MPTAAQNLYTRVAQAGSYDVTIGSSDYNLAVANPNVFSTTFSLFHPGFATITIGATPVGMVPGVLPNATTQSGTDVRSLQAALNKLPSSLARLAVDGVAGPKTTARVMEFQRLNGLPATGVVDLNTSVRLYASVGSGVAPKTNNAPSNNNPLASYMPPPAPR
jgi:peptidoglycan hydrolase-like protein with peptidoglycan-binding domain